MAGLALVLSGLAALVAVLAWLIESAPTQVRPHVESDEAYGDRISGRKHH